MEPIYLSIQQKETGKQIKRLLMENGYTVKDVQSAMGFENPQAIYKWMSGRSLPSLDNFIILSRLLNSSIEDILVIDGDIVHLVKSILKEKTTLCTLTSIRAVPISKAAVLSQADSLAKEQEPYPHRAGINGYSLQGSPLPFSWLRPVYHHM